MEIVNLRHIQQLKNALLRGSSHNDALAGNLNKNPYEFHHDVYPVLIKRYDNK